MLPEDRFDIIKGIEATIVANDTVAEAMALLSTDRARRALFMQEHGFSQREIAEELGLPDAKSVENLIGYQLRQLALADHAKISTITARQRVDALTSSGAIRLATEIDLRLLGVRTEALIWMFVEPTILEEAGLEVARQPQVRFAAATTGATNLLLAVATQDRRGLYAYLTESLGPVTGISALDISPILVTMKRTGFARTP